MALNINDPCWRRLFGEMYPEAVIFWESFTHEQIEDIWAEFERQIRERVLH